MKKASIIIRTFNEEKHIGRLLAGILQQTVDDIEIIVVDSGSEDATLAIASRFPVQILSIEPEEFSFGRSLNIGCSASDSEFIVIASAHVYPVYRDWLHCLLAPFSDSGTALVYGCQRGGDGTRFSEHQVFKRWYPSISSPHQNSPFCNNANAVVRRSVWEMVPYNETLTALEDLEWAKQVTQRGWNIAYSADAVVIHLHDESAGRLYNRYRREAIAFKRIFPEERFTFTDFIRFFPANLASDWYKAWQENLLGKNLVDIVRYRLMQFWGTHRGFARRGPITSRLRETFYYPDGNARASSEMDKTDHGRCIEYGVLP